MSDAGAAGARPRSWSYSLISVVTCPPRRRQCRCYAVSSPASARPTRLSPMALHLLVRCGRRRERALTSRKAAWLSNHLSHQRARDHRASIGTSCDRLPTSAARHSFLSTSLVYPRASTLSQPLHLPSIARLQLCIGRGTSNRDGASLAWAVAEQARARAGPPFTALARPLLSETTHCNALMPACRPTCSSHSHQLPSPSSRRTTCIWPTCATFTHRMVCNRTSRRRAEPPTAMPVPAPPWYARLTALVGSSNDGLFRATLANGNSAYACACGRAVRKPAPLPVFGA